MVEVRKKDNENSETLLRRFTRRWQESGIGVRARKRRFYQKDFTKREKRIRALYRVGKKKEYETLEKLGKLEEEHFRKGKIYQRRSI
jgi:ribosomal protein S21